MRLEAFKRVGDILDGAITAVRDASRGYTDQQLQQHIKLALGEIDEQSRQRHLRELNGVVAYGCDDPRIAIKALEANRDTWTQLSTAEKDELIKNSAKSWLAAHHIETPTKTRIAQ